MTGVLIKKGKSGHRDRSAQMEEDVKMYRNKAATYLQAKEAQGLPADTEARGARKDSPREPSERAQPCRHLELGLPPSRTVRRYIPVVVNQPMCGVLLQRL